MAEIDPATRTVDVQFAVWGRLGSYQPAEGPAVACSVIVTRPQEIDELGQSRLVRERRHAKVRAAEATPAEGGRFVIGAADYRVIAAPRKADPLGLIWTCEVAPA